MELYDNLKGKYCYSDGKVKTVKLNLKVIMDQIINSDIYGKVLNQIHEISNMCLKKERKKERE